MTREEIIQGLQFTIDMFLSDPLTGEPITKPRNDMDKTTIDACKGAIELLTQEPCEDAISREQAVDAVANLFEMNEYPHPYSQGKPIRLRDIKEKLKQLPPVQSKLIECEDAISREDALMCMTGEFLPSVLYEPEDIISKRVQRIKALPSVRSKIKTGHWIHTSGYNWHCSECDFIQHESKTEYKYCPNCGAKMVEPQESEDKE